MTAQPVARIEGLKVSFGGIAAVEGLDFDVAAGVGLAPEAREFAVTQRSGVRCASKLDTIQERDPAFDATRYHAGDLTSLRTRDYRYQRSESGEELFALPDEMTDVAGDHPDVRETLAGKAESWLGTYGVPTSEREEQAEFDESMTSHLEDLGYL